MKITNQFYLALLVLLIASIWPFFELYCINYVSRLQADELKALDGTMINRDRARWTRASTAASINEFLRLTDRDSKDVVDVIYADVKAMNTNRNRYGVCNRKMRWCKNRSGPSPWSRNGKDRVADEISNPYVRGERGSRSYILDNLLFEECIHGKMFRADTQDACSSRREDVCRYADSVSIWGGCGMNVDIPVRGVRARRARILIISLKYLHSNTGTRTLESSDGVANMHHVCTCKRYRCFGQRFH